MDTLMDWKSCGVRHLMIRWISPAILSGTILIMIRNRIYASIIRLTAYGIFQKAPAVWRLFNSVIMERFRWPVILTVIISPITGVTMLWAVLARHPARGIS